MNCIVRWSLFVAFVALFIKILLDLDFNRVVFNHTLGKCEYIDGIKNGSEDIVLLKNGLALISSGMILSGPGLPWSKFTGKIYLIDAKDPKRKAESLQIGGSKFYPDWFQPSGLSVWEENGKTLLYAVNSYNEEIYVFQLDLQKRFLSFVKNITDDLLTNPNNLIVVGEDQFYVSNFHYFNHFMLVNVELALRLPFGSILFYDKGRFVSVVDGLRGPNGVGISNDKKFLYVALHIEEELRVYNIHANHSLSELLRIPIPTGLDNINVDVDGNVWIGAQQVVHQVILHIQDPLRFSAPSQVLRVSFNPAHTEYEVIEVFSDDGKKLKGVTSAALYKNTLLIGSLYDKAMFCQLP